MEVLWEYDPGNRFGSGMVNYRLIGAPEDVDILDQQ